MKLSLTPMTETPMTDPDFGADQANPLTHKGLRRPFNASGTPPLVQANGNPVSFRELQKFRSELTGSRWGQTEFQVNSAGGPGRSRDYSLELPQILACTLNAPGSSHCGIAVPHTTGGFRGDTLVRHSVLGVVPTPRPQRGTPFAPRGPGGPFPRLNTTMGHCDSLPPISPRFVSFAWRYHRCVPCSSPSAQDLAVDHPGVFNPVLLPAGTMETARSPKFP